MTDTKSEWQPRANPWLIAAVVTMAAFMEVLDTTIVNVALPHIAGALGCSYDDATWSLTSYLVANGIVLTVSGWLSKRLGRKRYFLICIASFTLCSLLCGLSQSLPMLVLFRLLQGLFGGGLQPSQQAIILDTFPPAKRGAAFGLAAIATVIGPILGPSLGGWLTDNFSWRWIFFVNIPFGIVTMISVSALVEDPPWAEKKVVPIDRIGIALITLGLGSIEIMCDRGEDADWFGSTFIVTLAVIALISVPAAIWWMSRSKNPLIDLNIFKDRNFAVGTFLIAMVGGVLYASEIIVPQFAQQIQGYTATKSGMILAPGGVVVMLLIPLVQRMMGKIQTRFLIAFGFSFMGISMFISANLVPYTDYYHLVYYRILQTAALSFLFVPLSTIAYSTLPKELNNDASAIFSMARNYVGSLGISLATAIVTETQQKQRAHLVDKMTELREAFQDYLSQVEALAKSHGFTSGQAKSYAVQRLYQEYENQASLLAYNEVFIIVGILALSVVPFCFLLTAKK